MPYEVKIKRKIEKGLRGLPENAQKTFWLLVEELRKEGPFQKEWSNYGELKGSHGVYHCHLCGSYVACWSYLKKSVLIEVCYVGSREDAPY